MTNPRDLKPGVPLVRLFKARAHPGKERELAEKLARTSPTVVKGKAGFLGYLTGGPSQANGRDFFFITIWRDFPALKEVFGDAWRESHLPPGYAELIEAHSIEHYELTDKV